MSWHQGACPEPCITCGGYGPDKLTGMCARCSHGVEKYFDTDAMMTPDPYVTKSGRFGDHFKCCDRRGTAKRFVCHKGCALRMEPCNCGKHACKGCEGSGEVVDDIDDGGPDTRTTQLICIKCKGSGRKR